MSTSTLDRRPSTGLPSDHRPLPGWAPWALAGVALVLALGLRTVLGTDEAKKRWDATVATKDLSPLSEVTAPAPAGETVPTPREPQPLASLATPANPVLVVEDGGEAAIPSVKLIQVVGAKPAPAAEPAAQAQNAERIRGVIEGVLERQADLAIDTQLKSGG